jgi:hypothetical protein
MKNLIFKIRLFLMPSELKKGTWLVLDGGFYNMNNYWIEKSEKWILPTITVSKVRKKERREKERQKGTFIFRENTVMIKR